MICGAHMYKLLFQIFPTIHRTVAVGVSFDLCCDLCFSIRRVHLIKVLWTVQCACVYFVHSACIQWQNIVSMTVSNVAIKSVLWMYSTIKSCTNVVVVFLWIFWQNQCYFIQRTHIHMICLCFACKQNHIVLMVRHYSVGKFFVSTNSSNEYFIVIMLFIYLRAAKITLYG